MLHTASPSDTASEITHCQRATWRALDFVEKAALVEAMCQDCDALARAGIRAAEPNVTEPRLRWLLTARRYGKALATEALGPAPAT